MARHHPGVQVGQHADPADHCLCGNANGQHHGKHPGPRPQGPDPPDGDQRADRDHHQQERQHPIAKLDGFVCTSLTCRDKRVFRAAWPRGTAQPRRSHAYRSPGDDDADVCHYGCNRPAPRDPSNQTGPNWTGSSSQLTFCVGVCVCVHSASVPQLHKKWVRRDIEEKF